MQRRADAGYAEAGTWKHLIHFELLVNIHAIDAVYEESYLEVRKR